MEKKSLVSAAPVDQRAAGTGGTLDIDTTLETLDTRLVSRVGGEGLEDLWAGWLAATGMGRPIKLFGTGELLY